MHRLKRLWFFSVFALTTASAAPILIDNFETTQAVTVGPGGLNPLVATDSVITGANSIGGVRSVVLTRTTGTGTASILANTGVPGVLQYNSDSTAAGDALLIWDGNGNFVVDPTGLGGIDLTDGGTNTLIRALIRSDLIAPLTLTVYSSAGNSSSIGFSSPGGGTGLPFTVVDLLFSSFTPAGLGADFANVGAVTLGIVGPQSLDMQIDLIVSSEVPEPATFFLAGSALIGLTLLTRKLSR